jgi:hypothetical protein
MADIITLDGRKFKSNQELLAYTNAQYLALQAASDKIKKLEEEVTHLQQLLAATTPLIGDNKVEIYNKPIEQAVVEAQIQLLSKRALEKELTLEEVKTLDLLIKNKKLCEDGKTLETKKRKKKEYTDAELIEMAKPENTNG